MNISDKGIDLIKSFEAYMKKLPDGGCMAYRERLGTDKNGQPILDIATIGYGCTKGVKMGMRWSADATGTPLHQRRTAADGRSNCRPAFSLAASIAD